MTATTSTMLPLGVQAPPFDLPDTKGNIVSPDDLYPAPALLVIFMCNHCPFVKHILPELVELIKKYQTEQVAVVAINSNDIESFPEDSLENMAQLAEQAAFTFPYLFDETQKTAQAYHAACTPDFFLFDSGRKLVYRGQMDDSRPGNDIPITGSDLTEAIVATLAGKEVSTTQKPSIGCNIKWKKGNEPEYAK